MEDNENTGWFHCGRCGAFFGAEVGAGVPERCPACERDPVIDHSEMAFALAAGAQGGGVGKSVRQDQAKGSSHRNGTRKRKKQRSGLAVFVGIWVVILIVLAGAVNYFRGSKPEGSQLDSRLGVVSQDQNLLSERFGECRERMLAFLAASAPESRAEFVMNPAEALPKMLGNQQGISHTKSENDPHHTFAQVIDTPIGKGIESVWQLEGSRMIEAVFFPDESGEWRIDWENMVRYSSQDWSLFLAGSGDDEGEFRLLARRRSEDHSGKGRVGSIVLIAPRGGLMGEIGISSPEVKLDPDSRIGRLLSKAFAKRDAEEGIYGSSAIRHDPKGMIRLRVRVLREGDAERTFVIREVLACHWYEFDDLGLED